MSHYRAQVVLPFFTNLPKDVITNTFNFNAEPLISLSAFANGITPLIRTFYLSAYVNGLANYINNGACYVKWYDMDLPEPREPYQVALGSLSAVNAPSTVPTEVSCVLSFEAVPTPGIPLARQRGRLYLGGIATTWMTAGSSSSFPTFTSTAVNAVAGAASAFRTAVIASNLGDWAVYSPTQDELYLINNGWVDNTPDTQRRRSIEATSRNLWT